MFVEYAKAGEEKILIKLTVYNRGKEAASLQVLPTMWFRNTWAWGYDPYKPQCFSTAPEIIEAHHQSLGQYYLRGEGVFETLFCDNETNTVRLYGYAGHNSYYKDGINDYLLRGSRSINPAQTGTKAAFNYSLTIPGGEQAVIRPILSRHPNEPFEYF